MIIRLKVRRYVILNILLATYSFYPYNYGGTEVYVKGLAKNLKAAGHQVRIIAGMPPAALAQQALFFEDKFLRAITYQFEELEIIGVVNNQNSTEDIYAKYRPGWTASWKMLLNKLPQKNWDILHLHSFTSVTGQALIQAAGSIAPGITKIISYHVAFSCPKGTLMYGSNAESCRVVPTVTACTACVLTDHSKLPLPVSKIVARAMPVLSHAGFPMPVRIKYLVGKFFYSFRQLDALVDQWQVFSDQTRQVLIRMKVPASNIRLIRHGVAPAFLFHGSKPPGKKIFLYASRFETLKGFDTLVAAWNKNIEGNDAELWLAGETQEHELKDTRALQHFKMRTDVSWKGKQTQEQLAALMKLAHCVIIPSECVEIGPLVFHEAIAAGCDVIASDIGGCAELGAFYKKKTSFFPARNPVQLAERIRDFNYSGETLPVNLQANNYAAVAANYEELVTKKKQFNEY